MKLQFLKEILYFLQYRNLSGGNFSLMLSINEIKCVVNLSLHRTEVERHAERERERERESNYKQNIAYAYLVQETYRAK